MIYLLNLVQAKERDSDKADQTEEGKIQIFQEYKIRINEHYQEQRKALSRFRF